MSITRHEIGKRLSGVVVHDNTAYLAGQVASDPAAGVKGQTEQILKKFDDLLAKVGSHKSKLLSATVYLANMGSYDEMNAAWDAWLDTQNPPARATVETRLANPRYLVEIMAVAAV
ncbi:MAG: RidA family protein [Candidatus Rokubacteria bacterium]|nr:RidA family protein [Candidatus Rokubacteria bacterium]MBI3827676.1 RidA family protein [Candidatus Rokubacteria bacterium]